MHARTITFVCILCIVFGATGCGSDSNGNGHLSASHAGAGSGDYGTPASTSVVPSTTDSSWVTAATPTENVYAVWGASSDDVWAVGNDTNILHWDGAAWSSSLSGTSGQLRGVWGSSADDVWAVGATYIGTGGPAEILHWDGSEWTEIDGGSAGTLQGIWGSGSSDVWAVGSGIAHWDGEAWTVDESMFEDVHDFWNADAHAIWGSAANDVWVVGGSTNNGFVLHWDGKAWEKVVEGSTTLALSELYGVWGSSASDVWALGDQNMAHWDGTEWKIDRCSIGIGGANVDTSNVCPGWFKSVWGSSANDIWAVGGAGGLTSGFIEHWDGSSWTTVQNGMTHGLTGVWGTSANDIWAVGSGVLQGGFILHYNQ